MESFTLKNRVPANASMHNRAFTLLEMMVCIAIIGILSAILIVSQSSFSKGNVLTDTTYTIALSVREAQSLGLSSRAFSGIPNAGYGVHFGDSTKYYDQFADIVPAAPGSQGNANCPGHASAAGLPDSRPGDCYETNISEQFKRYSLSQGYTITKICGSTNGGTSWSFCTAPAQNHTLDILYERPNTQAVITFDNASAAYTAAAVDLQSPQGGLRCVIATQLGEVLVSSTCP
jgi:prepilin-type N-terminal cleavage/methylation domain-containing protein